MASRAEPRASSIEALHASLDALVRERQHLRVADADAQQLERNRQAIVRRQWQLAAALIARHIAG